MATEANKILVGLGWDAAKGKLFGKATPIDLDLSAFVLKNGKLQGGTADFVYAARKNHSDGAIIHSGDDVGGKGAGDDEVITADLTKLPFEYDRVIFFATINKAKERKQDFSTVKNAYIRIANADNGVEIFKLNLSDIQGGKTALIFAEAVRGGNAWVINLIGESTYDTELDQLATRY
ncbi:MAG: TerD family protein [Oscillospiraceae bacterium]|jgi:stress response protein SCP2|nr:TerD family protein [Oscillospiraceae bacterium]